MYQTYNGQDIGLDIKAADVVKGPWVVESCQKICEDDPEHPTKPSCHQGSVSHEDEGVKEGEGGHEHKGAGNEEVDLPEVAGKDSPYYVPSIELAHGEEVQ